MRYDSLLKKRGYKPYMITRTVSVYNKERDLSRATCVIEKKRDRGVKMTIKVTQKVKDDGTNLSDFHKGYLENEAAMIKQKFLESRECYGKDR